MPVSRIELPGGFSEHALDPGHTETLKLVVPDFQTSDALIRLNGRGKADLAIDLGSGSNLNLFYLNAGQDLELSETYTLAKDSRLSLAYADFNDEGLIRKTEINLVGEGAEVSLRSAILVKTRKELTYRFNHLAPLTKGEMENFAVTLGEGSMNLYAIGNIAKSAFQSETHQTSRILNFNSTNRACVYPQLFIDNNDVKASHAQSSGQVDPDQLYYLQSRGLSQGDAVRLIIQGYLTSILSAIQAEDLKESLMLDIGRKVDVICSM